MGNLKNPLIIIGIFLLLFGAGTLLIPTFTTQNTTDVAKIGDLKIQTQQETPHTIPLPLSGGALLLGAALLAAGLYRRT
jgi:hypothetical protein